MPRAVALFSGGLDSMLSVRILQRQGFDVEALNIRTIYSRCRATAAKAALALGARVTVIEVGDDYLDVIRNPLYGYGKGANPCIDCRVYMCRIAKRFMEEADACVVITGEIVGQRPMSQKREHLQIIARRCGMRRRLLRPLSAKLLEPTAVELEGLVDREKLYDFSGRARRQLIELADKLGITRIPSPSTGCALTEPLFARRVFDLMQFRAAAARWDFDVLNYGRHFRFNERTKIVVGRSANENAALRSLAVREDAPESALLLPDSFRGPDALVIGRVTKPALEFAGALMLRFGRLNDCRGGRVRVVQSGRDQMFPVQLDEAAQSARTL